MVFFGNFYVECIIPVGGSGGGSHSGGGEGAVGVVVGRVVEGAWGQGDTTGVCGVEGGGRVGGGGGARHVVGEGRERVLVVHYVGV